MMNKFAEHFGHDIVIAKYTDGVIDPEYSLECETCVQVLILEEELFAVPFQIGEGIPQYTYYCKACVGSCSIPHPAHVTPKFYCSKCKTPLYKLFSPL